MDLTSFVAVGTETGSGFIVGLTLGSFTGFLVGPAVRSWIAHREWAEASREARLADRLLERMEVDADGDAKPHEVDVKVGSAWRTHP
jgi:hypothetical protein